MNFFCNILTFVLIIQHLLSKRSFQFGFNLFYKWQSDMNNLLEACSYTQYFYLHRPFQTRFDNKTRIKLCTFSSSYGAYDILRPNMYRVTTRVFIAHFSPSNKMWCVQIKFTQTQLSHQNKFNIIISNFIVAIWIWSIEKLNNLFK